LLASENKIVNHFLFRYVATTNMAIVGIIGIVPRSTVANVAVLKYFSRLRMNATHSRDMIRAISSSFGLSLGWRVYARPSMEPKRRHVDEVYRSRCPTGRANRMIRPRRAETPPKFAILLKNSPFLSVI
jgi:hypothetical protein